MSKAIDYFFHLAGNFGFAILIATILIKNPVPAARESLCWSHVRTGKPVSTFPGHAPQILRLGGQDEGGAARDDGDPRAEDPFGLSRTLAANRFTLRRIARRGDDKMKQQQALKRALQEGEDQSARRLPADPGADPGVLRALV